MAKMWCIRCQTEVNHRFDYCHGRCGNNCEQVCSRCNMRTLTTTLSNPADSAEAAVRQAVGEAQRRAKDANISGDVRVEMLKLDACSGEYQCSILVYNTYTKTASVTRPV